MPCLSSEGMGSYAPDLRPELDRVTRIACSLLGMMEGMGADLSAMDAETRRWWEAHKAADAARLAREEGERRKQELRDQALAKLTPEERGALSISGGPYMRDLRG